MPLCCTNILFLYLSNNRTFLRLLPAFFHFLFSFKKGAVFTTTPKILVQINCIGISIHSHHFCSFFCHLNSTLHSRIILPNMPSGMPSLRRAFLPAQTMHESRQFTVSFIPLPCYTIHEGNSTLQSTAW